MLQVLEDSGGDENTDTVISEPLFNESDAASKKEATAPQL